MPGRGSGRERGVRHGWSGWNGEPGAEVISESDAEFIAGLGEAEESVAAGAAEIAANTATNLALGHMTADVPLGTVGVQRDLRMIEYHHQFGFIGEEALKETPEGGKAGTAM